MSKKKLEEILNKLTAEGRLSPEDRARIREAQAEDTNEFRILKEESEERFRKLFETSRDAIMTLAPPYWRFTSGNSATIAMFESNDEADFVSMAPWQLSPGCQPDGKPSDEKAKEMIEKAMEEGFNFFEWTHTRKSGEEFPATVLLSRMEEGGKTYLQATVRDVTEQKKLEAALMDEKEFSEQALEALDAMVSVHNIRTHAITHANQLFREMFGENIIGNLCYDIIHKKLGLPSNVLDGCPMREAVESGERAVVEHYHKELDRYYQTTAFPAKDKVIHVIRDVTKEKRLKKVLQDRAEHHQVLMESVDYKIFVVDKDLNYTFGNGNYISRMGLSSLRELRRKAYGDFHSVEETEEFQEKLKQVFETGESVRYQHQSKRKDDETFVRTLTPIRDGGKNIVAVAISSEKESIISVCMGCQDLREKREEWQKVANYFRDKMNVELSHGHCEPCKDKMYGDLSRETE